MDTSRRLDYHDPFHEFAGRLTEALEDNHLVVSGYAFLVDVDHMSREYRYVVHLEGEPSADTPQTFSWPWAELRFLWRYGELTGMKKQTMLGWART